MGKEGRGFRQRGWLQGREAIGAPKIRVPTPFHHDPTGFLQTARTQVQGRIFGPLVQELYQWKTDATVRAAMVEEFSHSPKRLYRRFRDARPPIETIVKKVKALPIDSATVTRILLSALLGYNRSKNQG